MIVSFIDNLFAKNNVKINLRKIMGGINAENFANRPFGWRGSLLVRP